MRVPPRRDLYVLASFWWSFFPLLAMLWTRSAQAGGGGSTAAPKAASAATATVSPESADPFLPVSVDLLDIECTGMFPHYHGVSSATWFQGDADAAEVHLRKRVALIVQLNPWLKGRIVSKRPHCFSFSRRRRRMQLVYDRHADCETDTTPFKVFNDASIAESVPYEASYQHFARFIVPSGRATVDVCPSPPLYSVALIRISEREFCVVDSISHMLADAHTFYALHAMLGDTSQPAALVVERCTSFTADACRFTGDKRFCVLDSYGLTICQNMMAGAVHAIILQDVSATWIEGERERASILDPSAERVSTNDLLMSWICTHSQPDVATMMVNMRSRLSALTNMHAGNYVSMIPFLPADYATPSLFRHAVKSTVLRRFYYDRPLPRFGRRSLLPTLACVTSWASLYEEIAMPGSQLIRHQPVLGGLAQYSRFRQLGFRLPLDSFVIFRPREGFISLLHVGSHLGMTSDRLAALG